MTVILDTLYNWMMESLDNLAATVATPVGSEGFEDRLTWFEEVRCAAWAFICDRANFKAQWEIERAELLSELGTLWADPLENEK